MELEKRFQQLSKELNYGNEPTDKFLDSLLEITQRIIITLIEDLKENEPYAKTELINLRYVISSIPDDMDQVREIDRIRKEE